MAYTNIGDAVEAYQYHSTVEVTFPSGTGAYAELTDLLEETQIRYVLPIVRRKSGGMEAVFFNNAASAIMLPADSTAPMPLLPCVKNYIPTMYSTTGVVLAMDIYVRTK